MAEGVWIEVLVPDRRGEWILVGKYETVKEGNRRGPARAGVSHRRNLGRVEQALLRPLHHVLLLLLHRSLLLWGNTKI